MTYIAFLRGINVGGNNRVKMADLKSMLEGIGLNRVETYIQSGNILFEAAEEADTLCKKITETFAATFGFSAPVVLRSAEELEKMVLECPFTEEEIRLAEEANTEGESLYAALCSNIVQPDKEELLNALQSEDDICRIRGNNIYLLFRHSVRNSKLANNLTKADASVTVRNWKTLNKLNELAELRK